MQCQRCGKEIVNRRRSSKYCLDCVDKAYREQADTYRKTIQQQNRKVCVKTIVQKPQPKPSFIPCYKKCVTCEYFCTESKLCGYILTPGNGMRNSEPEHCDKWKRRSKVKKKTNFSLAEGWHTGGIWEDAGGGRE